MFVQFEPWKGLRLNMKNSKQKNNGITLIALIVTIIVLLILAGVTIATLTGENGIITRAIEAREQTEIGREKEEIALAWNGAVLDKLGGTNITADDLNKQFTTNKTDANATGSNPITVEFDSGRSYTVDENGNIQGPGTAGTPETPQGIVATLDIEGEESTAEPIVPTGFSHTEGTVEDGYVIQDTSGNEFVWVPVDKNQKIKINVTSGENIESLVLTDPYGDDILTENDLGTSYNNENVEPTINGPYVLTVKAGEETKIVTLGVHSLYATDIFADWMLTEEYAENMGATLKDLLDSIGCNTIEEAYKTLGQQFKSMGYSETEHYEESVNENGGFYIGRYEASYEDGKVASKPSTITVTPDYAKENGMLWMNISQIDALSNAKNMYTSEKLTSSLLTGSAWDRTLGWLYETGDKTSLEIIADSSSWGNYADDTFSNTEYLINTGEYSETEANHIYDLAGNLKEWTTESAKIPVEPGELYNRVWRGR